MTQHIAIKIPEPLLSRSGHSAILTAQCTKCGHPVMMGLNEGDDGYEVVSIDSLCKHVEDVMRTVKV